MIASPLRTSSAKLSQPSLANGNVTVGDAVNCALLGPFGVAGVPPTDVGEAAGAATSKKESYPLSMTRAATSSVEDETS